MNFSFIGGGGVIIRNSHDITLNQVIAEDDSTSNSPDGVDVSDGSYNIVVSRSAIGRGAILVNSNAHDITVTTNFFYNGIGAGVEAYNGAQNVDITSNLIAGGCGTPSLLSRRCGHREQRHFGAGEGSVRDGSGRDHRRRGLGRERDE